MGGVVAGRTIIFFMAKRIHVYYRQNCARKSKDQYITDNYGVIKSHGSKGKRNKGNSSLSRCNKVRALLL